MINSVHFLIQRCTHCLHFFLSLMCSWLSSNSPAPSNYWQFHQFVMIYVRPSFFKNNRVYFKIRPCKTNLLLYITTLLIKLCLSFQIKNPWFSFTSYHWAGYLLDLQDCSLKMVIPKDQYIRSIFGAFWMFLDIKSATPIVEASRWHRWAFPHSKCLIYLQCLLHLWKHLSLETVFDYYKLKLNAPKLRLPLGKETFKMPLSNSGKFFFKVTKGTPDE